MERQESQLYEERLHDERMDGLEGNWFEYDSEEEAAEIGRRGRVAWEAAAQTRRDDAARKERSKERPLVWARDKDLTGLVALARRLREQHRESGAMMQLTASENQFGDGAQAAMGPFMRAAAQALPTSSWLERRRRDRMAASPGAGTVLAGAGSSEWESQGELSTSQSAIWKDETHRLNCASGAVQ